jgi:hypothetical protein
MEGIYHSGRPVGGFALGDQQVAGPGTVSLAAAMTGATAGLLAYVLKAPLWGAIVAGTGAAFFTKYAIDKAST